MMQPQAKGANGEGNSAVFPLRHLDFRLLAWGVVTPEFLCPEKCGLNHLLVIEIHKNPYTGKRNTPKLMRRKMVGGAYGRTGRDVMDSKFGRPAALMGKPGWASLSVPRVLPASFTTGRD